MTAPLHVDGQSQAAASVVTLYAPVLHAMRPGCGEEEQRLRCGILYLRDKAMAARPRARWDAAVVLAAIESIACVRAYASMPIEELREVRAALVRMMVSAGALEARGPGGAYVAG